MVRRSSIVGMLALAIAGCSASAEDSSGSGDSAQTVREVSFGGQIELCEKASAAAWENASSTMDMVEAGGGDLSCYRAILDNNARRIDAIRAGAGGQMLAPGGLRAERAFEALRTGKGTRSLCDVLYDASMNYGGTLQRVESVGCQSSREHQLARLAAAWVAWEDGTRLTISETGTPEGIRARIPALVEQILENQPTLGRAETVADVTRAIEGSIEAAGELCDLLADAGEMGGGTGARQQASGCRADAFGLLDKELEANIIPADRR